MQQPADPTRQNPPNFKPLFTVIEDATTGEQHHPHVHYVFSDDDPDVLTTGVLQALQPDSDSADETDPPAAVQERRIIINMARDGQSVASAQSLSPSWQVVDHSISGAASFNQASAPGDAGLMLRIRGLEPDHEADEEAQTAAKEDPSVQDLLASVRKLAKRFETDVAVLKKMANAAGMESETAR